MGAEQDGTLTQKGRCGGPTSSPVHLLQASSKPAVHGKWRLQPSPPPEATNEW